MLQSLNSESVLKITVVKDKAWMLTSEGETCLSLGSPEARLFSLLPLDHGQSVDLNSLDLEKMAINIGRGHLMKQKAAKLDKGQMSRLVDSFTDTVKQQLSNLGAL